MKIKSKTSFEIKKRTDEAIVYQRVINPKGRNPKEIKAIVENLPTATFHTISMEEYNHLKKIEVKLVNEFEKSTKKASVLSRAFISFLNI